MKTVRSASSHKPGAGNISNLDRTAAYSVTVLLTSLLFAYYKSVMPYSYGDTAFLLELLTNIADAGQASSSLLAQNAAEIKLATAELATYCQGGLASTQFTPDPLNAFSSLHAYIILYLLAPLAELAGSLTVMSLFTALAFAGVPCIAYVFLRKQNVSVLHAILASAVAIAHPAWLIASTGQFYVDRLFIPLALLYVLLLHSFFSQDLKAIKDFRVSLSLVFLVGVLGGFVSERNMLVIAIFSFGYAITAQTQLNKRLYIIGFSLLCTTYVYLYLQVFSGTADNARVQASLFHLASLIDAMLRPGLGEYLWFNLLLLIVPAILAPRLFLAVLPIAAINIFVTIGGAEKNGWATHYHSHYYGFIIAAFIVAIARVNSHLRRSPLAILRSSLAPSLTIVILLLSFSVDRYYKGQSILYSLWDYYGHSEQRASWLAQKNTFDRLAEMVPAGVTVTAGSWGMAAWYLRGNGVNLFPLGVGVNEYILANGEAIEQELGNREIKYVKLLAAVRYHADAEQANSCMATIMSEKYGLLAQQGSWLLFKKKSPSADNLSPVVH